MKMNSKNNYPDLTENPQLTHTKYQSWKRVHNKTISSIQACGIFEQRNELLHDHTKSHLLYIDKIFSRLLQHADKKDASEGIKRQWRRALEQKISNYLAYTNDWKIEPDSQIQELYEALLQKIPK